MAQNLNPGANGKLPAKRLIYTLMGGAGLVLIGGGGILVGLNSKLTTLQTAAQQKEADVSSNQQIAHRYQTTLENYTQTQARIQYLEASVSDKSYVPTLLAQLQALAAQTHLTVSAVRPTTPPPAAPLAPAAAAGSTAAGTPGAKKPPPPPPYDTLNVAVDVTGTYANTSMFLYSLTRFPKIISVGSVQMHPGAPSAPGATPQVTTNLKLTAFMFHDTDAVAAPNAAASLPTAVGPPPAANGTVIGAVGRAAAGAAADVKEVNTRRAELKTL
jgi:Tfp pilus assembly protein PilO